MERFQRFNQGLESVRGLAALTVLVWHWLSFQRVAHNTVLQSLGAVFNPLAGVAVIVFFVLSGFLLTNSFGSSLARQPFPQAIGRFYLRRALRIFPLQIVVCVGAFLGFAFLRKALGMEGQPWSNYSDFTARRLVATILTLDSHFNAVGWTLHYELKFYLVLPFVVYFLRKWPRVALPVCSLYCLTADWVFSGNEVWRVHSTFAAGIGLSFLLQRYQVQRFPAFGVNAVFGAVVSLLILLLVSQPDAYSLASCVAVLCAVMIFLVITQGLGARLLTGQSISWLGKVSFSVYLLHYPIFWAVSLLVAGTVEVPHLGQWLVVGTISIPLTLFLSSVTYRYFEVPFMGGSPSFLVRGRTLGEVG